LFLVSCFFLFDLILLLILLQSQAQLAHSFGLRNLDIGCVLWRGCCAFASSGASMALISKVTQARNRQEEEASENARMGLQRSSRSLNGRGKSRKSMNVQESLMEITGRSI
jgi:hypothetical protein